MYVCPRQLSVYVCMSQATEHVCMDVSNIHTQYFDSTPLKALEHVWMFKNPVPVVKIKHTYTLKCHEKHDNMSFHE